MHRTPCLLVWVSSLAGKPSPAAQFQYVADTRRNYDHVAGLWLNDGFLPENATQQARLNYGGYSIKNQYGLRIISLVCILSEATTTDKLFSQHDPTGSPTATIT